MTRNLLLNSLSPGVFERIIPVLEEVDLAPRHIFRRVGSRVRSIHFVESGLLGEVVVAGNDRIEVGLIGPEGMVGASIVLESPIGEREVVAHTEGAAYALPLVYYEEISAECPELSDLLRRYLTFTIVGACQTSLANARGNLETRLARWLLMAHDRVVGDVVQTTHEHMASTLGVSRPSMTVALRAMERTDAITAKRNTISIRDRQRLRSAAGATYGIPEAYYGRTLGSALSKG